MNGQPRRVQFTAAQCALCHGTGASNPDADRSMDWRDYLPCIACHGTGLQPLPERPPPEAQA